MSDDNNKVDTDVSENEVDVDFGNNIKIKSLKSTLADVKSKD